MQDLPKFGDKSYGRTSIERLIIWLESRKLINITITLFILISLIGSNSIIHNDRQKGLMFLILVSIVLISGTNPALNFFGSSAIAIFIALHLYLFGFNPLAIVVSLCIFVFFKNHFENNILWPVSVYLLFDSFFSYINIEKFIGPVIDSFSRWLFSENFFSFMLIMPLTYAYLLIERKLRFGASNSFLGVYGSLIFLFFCTFILFIAAHITGLKTLSYIGSLTLACCLIGVYLIKNLKAFLVILPLLALMVIVFRFFIS